MAFAQAAEPKPKARYDPPDQLLRRAPMAQAARSVAVNLSTNLHCAFDLDFARIHTVWEGDRLRLWGPPYSYAKTPFICDFDGRTLFSFPQLRPWSSSSEPLRTRFRTLEETDGSIGFSYDVITSAKKTR